MPDEHNNVALSKFEAMLKTNEVYFFDSQEFEDIIHHYLDAGKKSLAHKAISLGLEQHPTSVTLKLLLAELLIFDEKLEEANKILKQVYAIEPTNDEIYILKSSILSKQFKHEKAIEYLKIGLQYSEEPADLYSLIGMEYLHMDSFDEARENFKKCLEIDVEDYPSLYNVIYCFDMQNKQEEAITYLLEFIDRDPYSEIAWHQLGRQYYTIKKYEEALRAFDYAVIIDEFFVGGYLEKAKTLEKLEQFEIAIDNYLIALELDDPSAFAFFRIGECYMKMGKMDDAFQFFKKTVNQDPVLDKGWYQMADICCRREDYHSALYYINRAIQIDEVTSIYWRKYAEINLRLNFYEESITAFQKCIDLQDNTEEIWLGLADVLLFIGEFDHAMEILLRSQKYLKEHSGVSIRLSGVYFLANEFVVGKKYLKEALTLNKEESKIFRLIFPSVVVNEDVQKILKIFE